jgi:hypothetical protein
MSAASSVLYTGGGFTGGVGGATINLTGAAGRLWVNTETFDNATLNIGNSNADDVLIFRRPDPDAGLAFHGLSDRAQRHL